MSCLAFGSKSTNRDISKTRMFNAGDIGASITLNRRKKFLSLKSNLPLGFNFTLLKTCSILA